MERESHFTHPMLSYFLKQALKTLVNKKPTFAHKAVFRVCHGRVEQNKKNPQSELKPRVLWPSDGILEKDYHCFQKSTNFQLLGPNRKIPLCFYGDKLAVTSDQWDGHIVHIITATFFCIHGLIKVINIMGNCIKAYYEPGFQKLEM